MDNLSTCVYLCTYIKKINFSSSQIDYYFSTENNEPNLLSLLGFAGWSGAGLLGGRGGGGGGGGTVRLQG